MGQSEAPRDTLVAVGRDSGRPARGDADPGFLEVEVLGRQPLLQASRRDLLASVAMRVSGWYQSKFVMTFDLQSKLRFQ